MQPEQQNNTSPNLEPVTERYTPTPASEAVNRVDARSQPVIDNPPLQWTAHEYIYRQKNGLWFVLFLITTLVFIAFDAFFLKSYTFSVLVVVMAIAVVVYSHRPPRIVNYTLSNAQGLYVGEKLHRFDEFKAFSVLFEEGYTSIILIPVKRFLPSVSVYFPQELGERIVDVFGARLPMEKAKLDFIDILIQKIRL